MMSRFLQVCVVLVPAIAGYACFYPAVSLHPVSQAFASTLEIISTAAQEEAPPLAGEKRFAATKKSFTQRTVDKDPDSFPGISDRMVLAEPVIYRSTDDIYPKEKQEVQAVLVAKSNAVISSTLDGRIIKFPYRSGDVFEKEDILVEYDCRIDMGRLKEAEARARLTNKQLKAYHELKNLDAIANIELVTAEENHKQNLALVEQVRGRLNLCEIKAPYRGRVTNKMASAFEFAQTGRVLMEIASREPLQVEFLVPSIWLRWLNTGTPMDVYIQESGKTYSARVTRIHGEVDPVSQSVQITGEIDSYQEELLPGMSGRAIFRPSDVRQKTNFGFLGLMLSNPDALDNNDIGAP